MTSRSKDGKGGLGLTVASGPSSDAKRKLCCLAGP